MVDVKISALPALTTPALADLVAIVNAGGVITKKITAQDLMKILDLLTAYVTPLTADVLAIYDDANAETKRITPINLMKAVDLLTAYVTPLAADTLPIWDDVNSVTKKMTSINLMKVINLLAAWTTPAAADVLPIYDSANALAKKITPANFLKIINLLNALATADADDRLAIYDDDAVEVKKIPFSHTAINGTAPATKGGTGQTTYNKGDLLHASAANVLAALAIGTANHKLFVNAAGDLPEWATGIKIGSFTRDIALASGNQVIGGIGFLGSHIFCIGAESSSNRSSWGFSNGASNYVISTPNFHVAPTTGLFHTGTTIAILFQVDNGNYANGTITFQAGQFTIAWVKTGNPVGTVTMHYIVFR